MTFLERAGELQTDSTAGDPSSERPPRLVVIAASAGGVQALMVVLAGLPASFAVPVVVLLHLAPHHRSLLTQVLGRRSRLPVQEATDGQQLVAGTIYVAPPDHHLLVELGGTLHLTQTAEVHFVRPSADLLFSTAARAFGRQVVAVVLTGTGTDGTAGAHAVRRAGGTVVAQDAATSEYFGMPGSVIQAGDADLVLPLPLIADALVRLCAPGDAHPETLRGRP
jgi:two-component system chemotaxis response regulator CheB